MPRMPTLDDVNAARNRLRGIALHTPLERSRGARGGDRRRRRPPEARGAQPTGAFKLRGAHNKVAVIAESHPEAPLVTASSGNHGIAVAAAAARHDMRLTVLVGRSVSPAKLERLRSFETGRCTVELSGDGTDDAEAEARRRDDAGHAIYVPPYNDAEVVAGAATVAVEILEDWPEVEVIVVPVGGGGLIAGIGLWAKAVRSGVRIIGVQPSASAPLYAYFQTGSMEPMPVAPTIADGVKGNIERGSITWKLCRRVRGRRGHRRGGRDRGRHALDDRRPSRAPGGQRRPGDRGAAIRPGGRRGRACGGGDHRSQHQPRDRGRGAGLKLTGVRVMQRMHQDVMS